MAVRVGYDKPVKVVLAAVVLLIASGALVATEAQAVHSGAAGFGGYHTAAPPPSIAARVPGSGFGGNHFFGSSRPSRFPNNSFHHRPFYPVWGGYYGYPIFGDYGSVYPYDSYAPDNPVDDDQYSGGPTIFDRRGAPGQYPAPGTDSHSQSSAENVQPQASQQADQVPDQPETVLVFKDGHQAEIDNYAIVGDTLFDLSGGQRHKIALSELDLKATAQQNDDRGVDFQLPTASASN